MKIEGLHNNCAYNNVALKYLKQEFTELKVDTANYCYSGRL